MCWGLCQPLRLGSFLLLLVHLSLLLVGLGLGARLGLLALLGALVGLGLAFGLQCLVVGEVTGGLLQLALALFEKSHGVAPFSSWCGCGAGRAKGQTFDRCAARSLASSVCALAL